jgi:hypothetical protein
MPRTKPFLAENTGDVMNDEPNTPSQDVGDRPVWYQKSLDYSLFDQIDTKRSDQFNN